SARWLRPELEVVVEYTGITSAGVLRAPVFKGFAGEVDLEVHTPAGPKDHADGSATLLAQLDEARQKTTLEGPGWSLPVTNLDKALWPATAGRPPITKRDLLRYAITIAPLALPHLRDRPLTLLRFPNGIDGKKFYQRHWDQELPPFVDTVTVFADGENTDRNFLCCNTLPALLWLCQVADIEWHASLARTDPEPDARQLSTTFSGSSEALEASTLNYPDFLLFDLDPYIFAGTERRGEEPQPNRAAFEATCNVALGLKELLDSLGLESFVKTSGATGVHIYVPVERQFDYSVIRAAANTVCAELASQRPKQVTLEWATEKRTGKVFLDANQNARHKSLAAPYSPRAKPGGPVSLPQRWAELGKIYPGDLSLLDPAWATHADPWAAILASKHNLAAILAL
ncbi:MAG: DNA ligase D, partial [Tepidiformaceae bacterium]